MTKKLNYSVYMGFVNYLGVINKKIVIAKFISEQRAKDYMAYCEQNEDNDMVVFGIE